MIWLLVCQFRKDEWNPSGGSEVIRRKGREKPSGDSGPAGSGPPGCPVTVGGGPEVCPGSVSKAPPDGLPPSPRCPVRLGGTASVGSQGRQGGEVGPGGGGLLPPLQAALPAVVSGAEEEEDPRLLRGAGEGCSGG
jgi:hypothetical protein